MFINSHKNESMDQMLKVGEVAHLLHVHPTSVRRWQRTGALEAYRIGPKGSLRFKREAIMKFIDSSKDSLIVSRIKS